MCALLRRLSSSTEVRGGRTLTTAHHSKKTVSKGSTGTNESGASFEPASKLSNTLPRKTMSISTKTRPSCVRFVASSSLLPDIAGGGLGFALGCPLSV
eukprot:4495483-Pyramimonas_sp.AAC.1